MKRKKKNQNQRKSNVVNQNNFKELCTVVRVGVFSYTFHFVK